MDVSGKNSILYFFTQKKTQHKIKPGRFASFNFQFLLKGKSTLTMDVTSKNKM